MLICARRVDPRDLVVILVYMVIHVINVSPH